MSPPPDDERSDGRSDVDAPQPPAAETEKGGGHGRWMMIACCVPMLAIAIVLVATGVAGSGAILAAVACTAMMGVMMIGMSSGGGRA